MSNDNISFDKTMQRDRDAESGDSVARLLHLAGPRPAISAALQARVYAQTLEEWRRIPPARGRITRIAKIAMPVALAASMLLAVTFMLRPGPVDAPRVGTIARISIQPWTSAHGVETGDTVRVGDTLRTRDGQLLSVALPDGTSLRLASNTALQLDAKRSFTLLAGEIYADTGPGMSRTNSLEVRTGLGVITDVGTQFLVSYKDATLDVAVREGRVDVRADRETYAALAGSRITMQAGGDVTKDKIDATDSAWNWVVDVAPAFDIENRSLLDFLTWVSRETGKELIFTDKKSRRDAMAAILHGSIRDFTPVEAVASVLPTTALDYTINQTSIIVGR